jgi:hypothetical protein
MPEFQYDRKRFVEPVSISGLERATRRNAYDIDNKATQTPTTETTTPTTPIGPGGTLVTPPVISGPDGYPIPRALPGDDVTGDAWALLDGRLFGWFERTLLSNTGTSNTTATNLDDASRQITYSSTAITFAVEPVVRNNVLWSAWRYWTGSAWVTPTSVPVTHIDGSIGSVTGSAINTAFSNGSGTWQDGEYTYFVASTTFNGTAAMRLLRIAHGSAEVRSVSPAIPVSSNNKFYGIGGGVAWIASQESLGQATWVALTAVELGTQTVTQLGNSGFSGVFPLVGFSGGGTYPGYASFVLNDGRFAFLGPGDTTHYDLRLLAKNGQFTTQAGYFPKALLATSSSSRGCPVPNGNAKLVPTSTNGVWANLTPQGWQEVTFPIVNGTLANSFNQTSVRWKDQEWGTTLQWTTTRDLYEGAITS